MVEGALGANQLIFFDRCEFVGICAISIKKEYLLLSIVAMSVVLAIALYGLYLKGKDFAEHNPTPSSFKAMASYFGRDGRVEIEGDSQSYEILRKESLRSGMGDVEYYTDIPVRCRRLGKKFIIFGPMYVSCSTL